MSGSTDSLRKKVCVTVFLDELFEEVLEEDWKDKKQVKEVQESQVKSTPKSFKNTSLIELGSDKKFKVTSKECSEEQPPVQMRPRKHRGQSKFSKNNINGFKSELRKYEHGSCNKQGNECCEPAESLTDISANDFDFSETRELKNHSAKNSYSSSFEQCKVDEAEKSFLMNSAAFSSKSKLSTRNDENLLALSKSGIKTIVCHKSIQFDGVPPKNEKHKGKIENEVIFDKENQGETNNFLPWKKTQREIYLLLTKSRQFDKEKCERDCIRDYDLNSVLKECGKTEVSSVSKNASGNLENLHSKLSSDNESDARFFSDSYSCIFLQNKQTSTSAPEVKRVWTSTRRNLCNDELESDVSEGSCTTYPKEIGLESFQKDSLLFYTLCVNSKQSFCRKVENYGGDENGDDVDDDDKEDLFDVGDDDDEDKRLYGYVDHGGSSRKCSGRENLRKMKWMLNSKSFDLESSSESIKSKVSEMYDSRFQLLDGLSNKIVFSSKMKVEEKALKETQIIYKKSEDFLAADNKNKNFAEGDSFEKSFHQNLNLILDLEEKKERKSLICDGILKNAPQDEIIRGEIIVSRADIELLGDAVGEAFEKQPIPKKSAGSSLQSFSASEPVAQVYFNPKKSVNFEESLMDAESELTFADSESLDEEDGIFGEKCSDIFTRSLMVRGSSSPTLNLKDKYSRSKTLRKKDICEISEGNSLNDVKKVSAEVVLICESSCNNEVYSESRKSSLFTKNNNPTKLSECYLKDSKDSTMYLIEIPMHLVRTSIKEPQCDRYFQDFGLN